MNFPLDISPMKLEGRAEVTMFKIGDVVQLKSGGPLLTVSNPGSEGSMVTCEWFTKDGESRADKFHPATLAARPAPGNLAPTSAAAPAGSDPPPGDEEATDYAIGRLGWDPAKLGERSNT